MAALSLFLTRGPVISRNGSRRSLIETIAAKPNWKAVGYSIIVKEDQETTLGRVLFLHSKSLTAILRVFVLCQHWTKTRWIGNNDNNFARVDENFFTNNSIGSLSSSSSIRTIDFSNIKMKFLFTNINSWISIDGLFESSNKNELLSSRHPPVKRFKDLLSKSDIT